MRACGSWVAVDVVACASERVPVGSDNSVGTGLRRTYTSSVRARGRDGQDRQFLPMTEMTLSVRLVFEYELVVSVIGTLFIMPCTADVYQRQ